MTDYYHIREGILEKYTGREEIASVPSGVHTIGEGAFKGCTSLKKILLPAGLQYIRKEAFKGCRKLEEIALPQGLSCIGSYAFHRCHALKKILLPPSVTELGDCVFLYCDSLAEAQIPGVKKLGTQVFANDIKLKRLKISRYLEEDCICDVFTGCGNLSEISFADGECLNIISAVEVVAGAVQVPSLVRTIADDILKMMELDGRKLVRFIANIKHIEVPEGVEILSKSCFFDMRGMTTVSLPASLKAIESRAFRNCINLTEVSFNGEQVEIREDAFKNCTSLKLVRTYRGEEYTFSGISGLEGAAVPDMIRVIHRQLLGNFRISGTILLKYLGAETRVVIPEGITRIAARAFAGNEAVDRVILPESLQEIGAEAFRDCLLLQTVTFPAGLRRIGAGAFEHCVKLIRILLPPFVRRLEARTFRHCPALREIILPEGFLEIGEGAFYGCRSLKDIQFPQSLFSIQTLAFYRCTSLREVRLPASAKSVQSLAFAKSGVRLAELSADGREYGSDIFGDCTGLRLLILREGVRHIPDRLAFGCTALEHLTLPAHLTSVGILALEGTPFLRRWITEHTSRTEIMLSQEEYILWDGRTLEGRIHLPAQTRIIAGGAFYGNTAITELSLPDSVQHIGAAAFKGCRRLEQIFLPGDTKCAEAELFSDCCLLEKIGLTESDKLPVWKSIGDRAFFGCSSLSHLRLEEATCIGKEALAGCTSLLPCPVSSDLRIRERAFEGTSVPEDRGCGLYTVGSLIVSGEACKGDIRLPEAITAIAPYAFAGNRSITGIIFPEGLKEIGEGAFFGCCSLTSVSLPRGVQVIEKRAFEKCTGLTKLHTGAETIGEAAFAFCTGLQSITLPHVRCLSSRLLEGCHLLESCICGQAKEVSERSFGDCERLSCFDFSRLKSIGPRAFEGCDSLRQAVLSENVCLHEYALKDCGRLETVRLQGKGHILLREYALSGCTALRQVIFQEKSWKLRLYQDLLSEHLPETVRLVFQSALSCFEVEQEDRLISYQGTGRLVTIPAGIRRIEAEVFRDIVMLREADIPESVDYIGARAFHGTAFMELLKKKSPMVIINHMLLDGSGCTGEVVISEDIRLVCGWAFANGLAIERIRFLSDRVRVGEHAFRNCVFLREIILPDGTHTLFTGIEDRERELPPLARQAAIDSMNCFKTDLSGVLTECTGNISVLRLARGITAIGEGAFQDGNLLTRLFLPDTVTRIERRAFSGCKWLEEVINAKNVVSIGPLAFSGCGTLRSIELSEAFRSLGARAFEHCTSLEHILLPEGLEEIPERAFYRCHSLKHVIFPSTLKRIGKEAFAFCRMLTEITLPENVAVEEGAFLKEGTDVLP